MSFKRTANILSKSVVWGPENPEWLSCPESLVGVRKSEHKLKDWAAVKDKQTDPPYVYDIQSLQGKCFPGPFI